MHTIGTTDLVPIVLNAARRLLCGSLSRRPAFNRRSDVFMNDCVLTKQSLIGVSNRNAFPCVMQLTNYASLASPWSPLKIRICRFRLSDWGCCQELERLSFSRLTLCLPINNATALHSCKVRHCYPILSNCCFALREKGQTWQPLGVTRVCGKPEFPRLCT